jgi:hypothetical protein
MLALIFTEGKRNQLKVHVITVMFVRNDSLQDDDDDASSYTLTFTLTFPHERDTVYLAHCFPYRYV